MRTKMIALVGIAILFSIIILGCSSAPAVSQDSPSGKWSGDYSPGPDADRRESISVDLRWEDKNLRGTVHAGPRTLPLTKASFNPDTGLIAMEFDAEGNGGRTVHYVIEGLVKGNTMNGIWSHDDQRGLFQVTKQ
jgi:hypothetical protein